MSTGMLGTLPLSAVRGPVDALYDNLASAEGQRVLDELKKFNRRQPCWQSDTKAKQDKPPKLLVSDGHYGAVEMTGPHDPSAFWQTRSGLYVYDDFQNRVAAAAKPTEVGTKFKKLPRFKLGRNATGEELKDARPNGIWTATDFCPWLAAKLAKQANGEKGEFLNNGWANLFLVEGVRGGVFVVDVDWDDGGWSVCTWHLDYGWDDGCQFGSRN